MAEESSNNNNHSVHRGKLFRQISSVVSESFLDDEASITHGTLPHQTIVINPQSLPLVVPTEEDHSVDHLDEEERHRLVVPIEAQHQVLSLVNLLLVLHHLANLLEHHAILQNLLQKMSRYCMVLIAMKMISTTMMITSSTKKNPTLLFHSLLCTQ